MSRDYVLRPYSGAIHLQIDYARELNEQQLQAVTAPPGPSLVIAGAGSGKTRTLTYRVAYLLEQGIPPERVLLLTFTNKAAREMMRRVTDLLGTPLEQLWGGTFHSIGHRILRRQADLLGYKRDFSIMDRDDSEDLVSASLGGSGIDIKATRFPRPALLADIFSFAANTQRPIAAVVDEQYRHFAELAGEIARVHDLYQQRKRAINALDFDDLLVLWLRLLQDHEPVRENFQRRFQFILVDEYQDTNKLQSDIIDLLAARHHNLMVVGDDAQSIYAWRGANYHNILKFPDRYPEAKIYRIETNYRSTPEILQAANAAIAPNTGQFAKHLVPARKAGVKPGLVTCQDSAQQARFVAQRALELRDEGIELRHMAVLYRSHFHALELQVELTRRNIPFAITSGLRFFEQAHIKDVAAYLRFVVNPRDELAFKRLAQMMPGIGAKGADKLWQTFIAGQPQAPAPSLLAARLQLCAAQVPKKAKVSWAQFLATIAQLEAPEVRPSASRMLKLVIEAEYQDYLKATYTNHRQRLEDVQQLAVHARDFASPEDFLAELSLMTNVEAGEDAAGAARDDEKLRLSTIHQAKGLEFEVVFIIMLCDGLFPTVRATESHDTLEEERRLLYVAITRARNELYLSYPIWRASYGGTAGTQHPSRFLADIPAELLEEVNLLGYGAYWSG
jgi:DNA helicase-2/ATP-dependent DNA helicase PcrA